MWQAKIRKGSSSLAMWQLRVTELRRNWGRQAGKNISPRPSLGGGQVRHCRQEKPANGGLKLVHILRSILISSRIERPVSLREGFIWKYFSNFRSLAHRLLGKEIMKHFWKLQFAIY